ncbi:MAG: hypothetical protein IIV05_02495 [Ruminococcus sp.]|nr:hypothetical protein [Ruminococcus sp.]MBQ1382024.1 hypothetical protein [Ruminococcus sp.]MBQ1974511.1 hypothetical protein [Ruminococcus sp.]MBQ2357304.1 hypothetical protein [Ruminococcus sp.]MBQ3987333.1 hypothetical protein [Ruminococcus sp.]
MRFPNACKGLKKIFFAELISLIALVPYAVSLVLVQFLPEEINKNNAEILPAEVVVTILSILSLVMMTVAYVLNVIGYVTASKDNESFKKAMLLTIAGMVLTVVSGIMENANGNPILTNTFDSMENILDLLITLMTISGIVTLSVTYGDLRMVESGKALFKFLFAIYLPTLIAYVFVYLLRNTRSAAILAVTVTFISFALNTVYSLLYLRYLYRAVNMLEE